MAISQGAVQNTNFALGSNPAISLGKQGDQLASELHGRFYTQTYAGNVYSSGMTTTSINNATFTTADALSATLATAATSTPIVGIWNPASSTVNAVILQATMSVTLTSLTSTGGGAFVWVVYAGNGSISTGTAPVNRKTLTAVGSQCKGLSGLALTGLTNTGVLLGGSVLDGGSSYNVSEVATAVGFMPTSLASVENIDGSIIVPPGGILGLFATTTPVAHSAATNLIWEEVAL